MKAEDNEFPSVLFDDQGSTPATPASGFSRVFSKSDGLYIVDDAGGVTGPFVDSAGSGGGGIGEFATKYNPDHETPTTTPAHAAEFNGSLDSGWAWEGGTAPSVTEDYTTYPGYGYFKIATDGPVLFKAYTPGATDLTIAAKLLVSRPVSNSTDTPFIMLGFSDSATGIGANDCFIAVKPKSGGASAFQVYDRNASSFSGLGSEKASLAIGNLGPLWIRLTRTVSGPTWSGYVSTDGVTWMEHATTSSKSLTVTGIVLRIADQAMVVAVDWIRVWNSVVARVGA